MFTDWSDDRFAAWLAGFFDGEGCIHLPKSGIGIELSIANTVQAVIEAIHKRVGLGIVTRIEFSGVAWKTKFHWRVRNYPEADIVLRLMRPHLVLKADQADAALSVIAPKIEERRKMMERNTTIRRLRAEGWKQRDIAEHFGICVGSVQQVLYRKDERQPWQSRKATDGRFLRRSTQRHLKTKATPTTAAEVIAG
jgi:hypothetical protein